jgi:uncharacterized protein (DUF1697 family)
MAEFRVAVRGCVAHGRAGCLRVSSLLEGERAFSADSPHFSRGIPVYDSTMALIVFLRGVNVGGHRTFRPSILASELSDYDVVNVGAAGTFVVRKPGSRAKFRAELLRKLPFEAEVMLCDGHDLIRLEMENPFAAEPSRPDVVRFVSILSKAGGCRASTPITLPPSGEWLVRLIASKGRFVFGVYRRHMKTISYLGQVDKLFGVPATTRNWNTIVAIVRILKGQPKKDR